MSGNVTQQILGMVVRVLQVVNETTAPLLHFKLYGSFRSSRTTICGQKSAKIGDPASEMQGDNAIRMHVFCKFVKKSTSPRLLKAENKTKID